MKRDIGRREEPGHRVAGSVSGARALEFYVPTATLWEVYLSQTAEYAIRAMSTLAAAPPGEALRAKDLSEQAGIPVHYLAKVLRTLVQEGLLSSERGHGGGFSLTRPAKKIRFIDVLMAVGQDPESNRCAFGWGECDPSRPCALHPSFSQMKREFMSWATRTTLADVAAAGSLNQVVRR